MAVAGSDSPVAQRLILRRRRELITADEVIKKIHEWGGDPVTVNKIEIAIAAIQNRDDP